MGMKLLAVEPGRATKALESIGKRGRSHVRLLAARQQVLRRDVGALERSVLVEPAFQQLLNPVVDFEREHLAALFQRSARIARDELASNDIRYIRHLDLHEGADTHACRKQSHE